MVTADLWAKTKTIGFNQLVYIYVIDVDCIKYAFCDNFFLANYHQFKHDLSDFHGGAFNLNSNLKIRFVFLL